MPHVVWLWQAENRQSPLHQPQAGRAQHQGTASRGAIQGKLTTLDQIKTDRGWPQKTPTLFHRLQIFQVSAPDLRAPDFRGPKHQTNPPSLKSTTFPPHVSMPWAARKPNCLTSCACSTWTSSFVMPSVTMSFHCAHMFESKP